jgi:VCBS repeat-containing protein
MFLESLERREVLTGLPPVAVNDSFLVQPDEPLTIDAPGILANDTDAEGDALSAVQFSGPRHGTLSLHADGSFSYTPEAGFIGIDSFMYRAGDGTGMSGLAAVTLRIEANSAPVASDDTFSAVEGSVLTIGAPGVLTNDTDADGDLLSAVLVDGPANGALTLNADGSFEYTPNADFTGADSFTYMASDGHSTSAVATVTINVNPVNAIPEAGNDTFSMEEDQSLTIDAPGLMANDFDADGDPLSAVLVSGPANGSLTLNADGSFSYIPNANYHGLDGFSYLVSDGQDESDVATVTITVNPVNDAPTALNDEATTAEDTPLTVALPGVLGNDSDADGDPMTAILVSGPANGSVTLNADGSYTYTPNADFHGVDGFAYLVSDGSETSDVATVTIDVTPVNDLPSAADDAYSMDEDAVLTIDAAAGVLANDSDADGDALSAILVSGPANGSLTLNADGSFEYTPNANFTGLDGFSYQVSDGSSVSDVATVTIDICPVNDTPIAADDSFTTDEDTPLEVAAPGILANDIDPDGDALAPTLVSGPANGTLTMNADGSFSYTPNANFRGSDAFTYTVSDGSGTSNEATVSITVNPVNDGPTARADNYSMAEDGELITSAAGGVLRNDTDPEGDPLSAILIEGPANGTLTMNADGSFSYKPNADFNGADTYTYQASDGTGTSEAVTVKISVNPVNDAPVAADDEYTAIGDAPLDVPASGVLANDSDVEGNPLTPTLIQGPAHGSVTLNADGSFTYRPQAGFSGNVTFTYQLNDGEADSNVATVTIHVTQEQQNTAPVAADDQYTVISGNTLNVAAPGVLGNDSDADGDPLSSVLVSGPSHGTLTLNADGSLSYTPEAGFTGMDSFTYQASDGTDASAAATVSIDVQAATPVPRNVTGVNDRYTLVQDTTLNVDAPGVLANDSDADGDPLSAVLFTNVQHGSLTLNSDGSFQYTPNAGFVGTDAFVYRATDGTNYSLLTAVTLRVTPAESPNPAPIPEPDPGPGDGDDGGTGGGCHRRNSHLASARLAHVAGMLAEGSFPGSKRASDVLEDLIAEGGQDTDEESVDDFFGELGQWT